MIRRSLRHVITAMILLVAIACQGTWALAGTTGGITGVVVDADSGAPVAGATVTANSPSQSASGTTDASGRFAFLTLSPDTYTISVSKDGYQAASVPGQVVFADAVQTVPIRLGKQLKQIANVRSTGGSLVKSGTTADVYSVNAATQSAAAALGGGGSLNSAYSAVATVPGAYVVPNQTGYFQTVHIRGGDYDQVGYEFDGVPINRSFDNYPSSSASSLGNAEVQVYTGANPANSDAQGLSGFINQVIKTGTYPGEADGQLGIGTPAFYHRAEVEAGGSTPDRNFSYYFGIAGYNQDFNYINNQNGSQYDWAAAPLAPSSNPAYAGGTFYALGPINYALLSNIISRDVVANIHIAIPHKNDAGRDDIQLLWDSEYLNNQYYDSTNDIVSPSCGGAAAVSGAACSNAIGLGQPLYVDGYQWNCQSAVGGTFSYAQLAAKGPSCTSNYYFPNSTNRTGTFQPIPVTARDTTTNDQEIVKVQYTKNIGSTAFVRLYGYSYYSDWLQNGPQSSWADYAACCSPDYELSGHTRGLSLQAQDQINAQNLLGFSSAYTTSSTLRDNNTQMFNFTGERSVAAVVVNAADPYDGYCYSATGQASTCNPSVTPAPGTIAPQTATWAQLQDPSNPKNPLAGLPIKCKDPNVASETCTYLLAENSQWATYNTVTPQFFSAALTDEFRPSDKLLFNLGARLDSYTFLGSDTDYGAARDFWFNAYNLDTCVNTLTGAQVSKKQPTDACPSGTKPANLQNTSGQGYTFNEWQPRIASTYTFSPNTVLRASFGRYTQAPNSAYEQYNTLEEDLPFALLGANLYPFGRNTPGYAIQPPTSLNYDLSLEERLPHSDISFKLTPFLRQTQNQIQEFFLNQKTGFVSGLNVGSQRSQGVEFQVQKGDFSRNGLAALFSFAYTNSYVNYGTLSNGTTIISPINASIAQYNAYTKACAPGGAFYGKSEYGQPLCGATSSGAVASQCYVSGAPTACTSPSAVTNPYYNAPAQNLLDPGQNFPTYDIFPAGIGTSAAAYGAPYVSTLVLNYKKDRLDITPSFQFQGGGRYGSPETTPGIDPAATGCTALAGSTRYNANTCTADLVIPDQYTGGYDNLGSFVQPNEFMFNMQASYDVTPRVKITAVAANIFNTCWGGTSAPWTYGDHNVCSYGIVGAGEVAPVGNVYNPGQIVQPAFKYPYAPGFGPYNDDGNSTKTPFQLYVTAQIKI